MDTVLSSSWWNLSFVRQIVRNSEAFVNVKQIENLVVQSVISKLVERLNERKNAAVALSEIYLTIEKKYSRKKESSRKNRAQNRSEGKLKNEE